MSDYASIQKLLNFVHKIQIYFDITLLNLYYRYITETIGGGSSRRDSNRMSLSTIFSSIGDLLPPATEKFDTTDSRTLDDVFTPSLTNIQQKIGRSFHITKYQIIYQDVTINFQQ